MKSYKFLEDIAIADAAFEAKGDNLEEVFEASADAVFETSANVKSVGNSFVHKFELENEDIEDLLYEFLEEIVYIKDKDYVVFSKCAVSIKKNGKYGLSAKLYGEKIDSEKQELKVDVKAVTMHKFELKKTDSGYFARVVLDI
tara:strand:- start:1827 stop:2255 length:429 start_codon:yes stop_codon:yes gene_type:complete